MKHYIIYKITNIVNNKIYIGKHITENIDDGYLGSGKILRRAVEKYGVDKFKKELLYDYENKQQMDAMEAAIVDKDFIKRKDVYNIKKGGDGGWDYTNSILTDAERSRIGQLGGAVTRTKLQTDKKLFKAHSKKFSRIVKQAHTEGKIRYDTFTGRAHTNETKIKQREQAIKRIQKNGSNTVGFKWVSNAQYKESKLVSPKEYTLYLSEGWVTGRKYNTGCYGESRVTSKGTVYIVNPKTLQIRRIEPNILEEFLSNGWLKGMRIQ